VKVFFVISNKRRNAAFSKAVFSQSYGLFEQPEFTVRQLGRWIRHTHLKDSVGSGEERRYVLTGRGTVPVRRQIAALRSIGYQGFYCFEWEKLWHSDLVDPEIAIADYSHVIRDYLENKH
jgi:sugar phosphate isomerase/epimerase